MGLRPKAQRLSRVRRGTTLGKQIHQPINPNGIVPSCLAETAPEENEVYETTLVS